MTTWRSQEPGFASRRGTSGSAGRIRRGPPMIDRIEVLDPAVGRERLECRDAPVLRSLGRAHAQHDGRAGGELDPLVVRVPDVAEAGGAATAGERIPAAPVHLPLARRDARPRTTVTATARTAAPTAMPGAARLAPRRSGASSAQSTAPRASAPSASAFTSSRRRAGNPMPTATAAITSGVLRVTAASVAPSARPKAAIATRPWSDGYETGSNGARTAGASWSAVQASPSASWGHVPNETASAANTASPVAPMRAGRTAAGPRARAPGPRLQETSATRPAPRASPTPRGRSRRAARPSAGRGGRGGRYPTACSRSPPSASSSRSP